MMHRRILNLVSQIPERAVLNGAGPSRWASTSAVRAQLQNNPETKSGPSSLTASVTIPSEQNKPIDHSQPGPLEPSKVHPKTHGHHVASLQLRASGLPMSLENLTFFTDFAIRVGYALGIPLARPASLPTRVSLWTVPKGPFVHKKSQENFERRTHKRLIKAFDADTEVVERWLQFLRIHAMPGVAMRVETHRRFPLSIGAQVFDASTSQLRSAPSAPQDDTTVRGSDPDQETVVKMADKIVREEFARQEAESARDEVEKIAEKKSDA